MPDNQENHSGYDRTKELTDRLEAGMKDLFESDKFKAYLKSMSHFHRYSSRNVMLINMQMPTATRVASYKVWKEKFKRHVKKGEHSIRIFAPIAEKKPETKLMQKLDPETGAPLLDAAGKPVMEEMTALTSGPRFKLVPVFDVSQTYGEPLPELVENLTGDVAHYEAFMDALRAVSPLPIAFEPMADNQDGYCRHGEKIGIRAGMSEIQTISAAVHEIAHAKLHDKSLTAGQVSKPKTVREIEAESVSYVVSQHFGIETSPNSFGYLAEYGSREMPELKASLETIRNEANNLITAIDDRFLAICTERGIDLAEKPAPTVEQPAEPRHAAEPGKDDVAKADAGLRQDSSAGHYEIYQLRDSDDLHHHRFASLKELKAGNLAVDRSNYDLAYTAPLSPAETLDGLYEKFNNDHPGGYTGRSLSVSDVVVFRRGDEATAHYVDTFGFSEIPAFLNVKADRQQPRHEPPTPTSPPVPRQQREKKPSVIQPLLEQARMKHPHTPRNETVKKDLER
jgi:hypothetical protein